MYGAKLTKKAIVQRLGMPIEAATIFTKGELVSIYKMIDDNDMDEYTAKVNNHLAALSKPKVKLDISGDYLGQMEILKYGIAKNGHCSQ